jgi:hypothetical protein
LSPHHRSSEVNPSTNAASVQNQLAYNLGRKHKRANSNDFKTLFSNSETTTIDSSQHNMAAAKDEAPDFRMADSHGYILSRGHHLATARLNLQHFLWQRILKFTIHPQILKQLPAEDSAADASDPRLAHAVRWKTGSCQPGGRIEDVIPGIKATPILRRLMAPRCTRRHMHTSSLSSTLYWGKSCKNRCSS